jgi:hypothetical protein
MDDERARRRRIFAAEIDHVLNASHSTTDARDMVEVLAYAVVEILARADKPDIVSTHFLDCLDEAFETLPALPASG